MPHYMYVALQDDNQILLMTMDAQTGKLMPKASVPVQGGPSLLAISPNRSVLYVGHRSVPEISSWRIDQRNGGLTRIGSVSPEYAPTYLSTDRRGRYLLSAYYQGGHAAVHPIGNDGVVGAPPIEWVATDTGAHAMQTDRSNRFAFVPHIARFNDNVLEPVKETYGPNKIFQFKFDETTGHLTPNSPSLVQPEQRLGPRHYCFHPTQDFVYFSNEQGCSVTAYRMDSAKGTLSAMQTISTLPAGYAGRNTCSQIQITSSGRFLYVPNRGHNSIAGFSADASTGRLSAIGQVPTEAVPSAFSLDPEGKFLFAAGSASGGLASYRINPNTGALTYLETYPVGKRPMWVLVTSFGA
ncbi:MAG: lactonase family protein [SAR202 cluster bacterium]|nr:lactonase family protein [SAR202 cluster bacterium]